MNKRGIKIIVIVILLMALDFVSKFLVTHFLKVNEDIVLIKNFLKFTYIKNTGAAFGILNSSMYILIIITIALIIYIIWEIVRCDSKIHLIAYVLILSGALGNLIDRVFRKFVVDFISFSVFGHKLAIFNVADIYITVGVILFLYTIFKGEADEDDEDDEDDKDDNN